jgi:hypothetical protein
MDLKTPPSPSVESALRTNSQAMLEALTGLQFWIVYVVYAYRILYNLHVLTKYLQIAGLKDSLEYNEWSKEDAQQHQPTTSGADLLVGSIRKASRAEILASLPPRSIADRLVEHVLRSGDIAIGNTLPLITALSRLL